MSFTVDTNIMRGRSIETYMHCSQCMEQLPAGTSPAEYARLNLGFTSDGSVQVWCTRHDINVVVITPVEND